MDSFQIGWVLVVCLTIMGCAEQPDGKTIETPSKVEAEKGEEQSSKNGGNEVELPIDTEKPTEKPTAIAHFEAGLAAYESNDPSLAYREFLAAAREGHADSQFNLAVMCEHGIGIVKDEQEAVVWYDKSATQGNSAAQFNLGVLYENGRGTKVDYAKAHEWYRKASVQHDALAIGNLGMLYVRGQGVKENKVAGVALLLVSATEDPSPENFAKQNITTTRGLSSEMIVQAQSLAEKLQTAENLLIPLDEYLKAVGN